MSGKMTVEMDGNSAKLWQALESVHKQQEKVEKGLGKMGAESRRSAAEARQLTRAAKRVYELTRTPQERYNAKLRELGQLLKARKIDHETHGRAVRNANTELKNAGQAGKKAFGKEAVGQVGKMAAGVLSVAAAVRAVTAAMSDQAAMRDQAAEDAKASRMGVGALAQVANSPAEMKRLIKAGDDLYAAGGAPTRDAAMRTVFAVKSAGQMDQLDMFRELRASGMVESPDIMARSAATLIASMGKKETGGLREVLSKALGASSQSPATAEALLAAASRGGGIASAIGVSDEELLAATARAATATGTAEQGATTITALLTSMEEAGLTKGTFGERLQTIKAGGGIRGEKFGEFFGRKEARRGYRLLQQEDRAGYREALKAVTEAERVDAVGQKLEYHKQDKSLLAARGGEEAEARLALSKLKLGADKNVADIMQKNYEDRQRRAGTSEWGIWALKKGDDFSRWALADDQEYIRLHGDIAEPKTRERFPSYFPQNTAPPAVREQLGQRAKPAASGFTRMAVGAYRGALMSQGLGGLAGGIADAGQVHSPVDASSPLNLGLAAIGVGGMVPFLRRAPETGEAGGIGELTAAIGEQTTAIGEQTTILRDQGERHIQATERIAGPETGDPHDDR